MITSEQVAPSASATLRLRSRQFTLDSLNVLQRQPQGSAWNDSQDYSDEVDSAHPFHFQFVVPSNVLKLNHARLSFFLLPFRTTVSQAVGSSTSSGPSSSSTSGTGNHRHGEILSTVNTTGADLVNTSTPGHHTHVTSGVTSSTENIDHSHQVTVAGIGGITDFESTPLHAHDITHTHTFFPNVSLTYGIFESTSPAGVTVTVNGIDRTAALGGPFNGDQLELDVTTWMVIGQKNVIDLGSTQLGRIVGHLRLTGYIQSN